MKVNINKLFNCWLYVGLTIISAATAFVCGEKALSSVKMTIETKKEGN